MHETMAACVVESRASLRSELYWPLVLPNTPKPKFCGFSGGLLTLTAGDADLPSEVYWSSVLPNTPMPQAVKNSLRPDLLEDQSTPVEIGKGTSMGFSKEGGAMNMYAGVKPAKAAMPFSYHYAATKDQLHAYPNVAIFFLEKDMHPGMKLTLHFTKTTNATFLPHQVANSLPFSSDKLAEILDQLSIKPESVEAETIKNTIEECEDPGIKGEEKYCATSLESMIDFSTSKLGNKGVKAVSTEAENKSQMKYRIAAGLEKMGGDFSVVCHKMNYPYAVFYCHKIQATRAYMVPLVGRDGTKAKAVAVCHANTMEWNPNHLAFQLLKVKPGTAPICHFLPEDHVVWVAK
ncbi:BURP domain protein RD22 [Vitis vinifera]|uniref:BURP domain protein RD22 n=1 Tax=Vitis vinifera TaxID=29760 RepID=A0A438FXC4_VITVI|nr:BURP domain protein RD22 [Vitis vinifera]